MSSLLEMPKDKLQKFKKLEASIIEFGDIDLREQYWDECIEAWGEGKRSYPSYTSYEKCLVEKAYAEMEELM